jgi:hypothetical protein
VPGRCSATAGFHTAHTQPRGRISFRLLHRAASGHAGRRHRPGGRDIRVASTPSSRRWRCRVSTRPVPIRACGCCSSRTSGMAPPRLTLAVGVVPEAGYRRRPAASGAALITFRKHRGRRIAPATRGWATQGSPGSAICAPRPYR